MTLITRFLVDLCEIDVVPTIRFHYLWRQKGLKHLLKYHYGFIVNILPPCHSLPCGVHPGSTCVGGAGVHTVAQRAAPWIRRTWGGRRQQGQSSRATDTQSVLVCQRRPTPSLPSSNIFPRSSGNQTSGAGIAPLSRIDHQIIPRTLAACCCLFSRTPPYTYSSQDTSYLQ